MNQPQQQQMNTAWQEQIQAKITTMLNAGRTPFANLSTQTWQELRGRWEDFLHEKCAGILAEKGKPIRAEMLEEIQGNGFRMQKIVFESFPGWQVGLNLYLPSGKGPFVPVLCPCGHGSKWLDDHQIAPQVLARRGFAAALFDMPMFGEKQRGNDHFIQGCQAQMVGLWSNYFFLIDAVRAADYLETRQDMDFSSGMGVTGVSGGGFATLFIANIDKRVRAMAPVCSVTPFAGHSIEGLYTGCPENYMYGQAKLGLDFDHLLCLAAPIPALVIGGTEDELFRPDEVRQSYDQAKVVYDLQNAGDRLAIYFEKSPHKYTQPMAEQTAAWMRRWLLNETDQPQPLPPVELLPRASLDCGTSDTTLSMLQVIQRETLELAKTRSPQTDNASIRTLLGISASTAPCTVEESPQPRWGYPHLHKLTLTRPGDLPLPVFRAEFPTAAEGLTICFSDEAHKIANLRMDTGLYGLMRRVIVADIRGYGELAPPPTDYDLYQWAFVDRAISDLIYLCGESALGQQVSDALCVLDALAADNPPGAPLVVYGRGEAALPALLAALLHPKTDMIILDSFLSSFASLATEAAPIWKRYAYLPDILRFFDIPELIATRSDKRFLLLNPLDANGERLDEVDAFRLFGSDLPHLSLQVEFTTRTDPGFDVFEDRPTLSRKVRGWLDSLSAEAPAVEPFDPKLAIDSGKPVRAIPLPKSYLGADLVGLNEFRNLRSVVGTRSLFRHYGPGSPTMTARFEQRVRERFGVRYALAVTSGSSALICALAGLGIGPGDEVILPAFSWYSCFNAIALHGAVPVFCEIDRSLNLDPADFERKITPRTKAVMVVHYQGSPADLDSIKAIAQKHHLMVLEDCAQAIGADYHGRPVGTIGNVGTFSLQGNKVITSGEGGIVVTNDPLIFERAVRYQDLGFLRPIFEEQIPGKGQIDPFIGSQYRMNELSAAAAAAQFEKLDWIIQRCRSSWCKLRLHLQEAAPDLTFRLSHDSEGDAGITLYLDLGSPETAQTYAEALEAEGIRIGPSSGMVYLLTDESIQHRKLAHPALPPFGSGHSGESIRYTPEMAPNANKILKSMIAIAISPRYSQRDVEDIRRAILKVHAVVKPR